MLLLLLGNQQPAPIPPTPPAPPIPPVPPTPPPLIPVYGNQAQILQRLQFLMPNGWFSVGMVPLRDAILTGFANAFAFVFSLLGYVRLQTRIATATDGFLDLIAFDFFGADLSRGAGQSDASLKRQIIALLFRKRNTRAAIIAVIQQLLGTTPVVIEPQRAADTGVYDNATTLAYDVAGYYGSLLQPLQVFVQVTVPESLGIGPPLVAGYGTGGGGYGIGQIEWVGKPTIDPVQVADIYAALDGVRPVTGVIWTSITAS
jgi:hypothetical protein